MADIHDGADRIAKKRQTAQEYFRAGDQTQGLALTRQALYH